MFFPYGNDCMDCQDTAVSSSQVFAVADGEPIEEGSAGLRVLHRGPRSHGYNAGEVAWRGAREWIVWDSYPAELRLCEMGEDPPISAAPSPGPW